MNSSEQLTHDLSPAVAPQLLKFTHSGQPLIIVGQSTAQLRYCADNIARYHLCLKPTNDRSCGTCKACCLINSGNHPDKIELTPTQDGHVIKIDAVRELLATVMHTPYISPKKVVIITPADALHNASANALLKTLEEPPRDTLFLLLARYPQLLPLTVRSRCQLLQLPAVESPSEAAATWHHAWLSDLIAVMHKTADPIMISERYQDQHSLALLDVMHTLLIDIIASVFLQEAAQYHHPDHRHAYLSVIPRINTVKLFVVETQLLTVRRQLLTGFNLNKLLLLSELLIKWSEVLSDR